MTKRNLTFFMMLVLVTGYGFAEKVASFSDFNKPASIVVDDRQIFVIEGTTIFIYSAKDYNLEKKFGKKGEGPQEFQSFFNAPVRVKLQPGHIIVNSLGKLSYFTRKGEYIKELKHTVGMGAGELFPMGDGFAATGFARTDNTVFITIELYDSNIKKIKEIFRMPLPFRGQKFKALERAIFMQATPDNIYVAGESDFAIDVFDKSGEKLYTIKQEYDNIKFTDLHEKEIMDYFKINPNTRQFYDQIKNRIEFPSRFPAVRSFVPTGKKLYVQTFLVKDGKTEFYIFDDKGKLLKKVWLPIRIHIAVAQNQLFTIYDDKLYQLVENEDDENWELHIDKIE